jgi:hypothetical protein
LNKKTPDPLVYNSYFRELRKGDAVIYMTWTTEYGHIYQDCLALLYDIDFILPEYDYISVYMTPKMQEVINFFGLKLSSKLNFILTRRYPPPSPEFTEEITIDNLGVSKLYSQWNPTSGYKQLTKESDKWPDKKRSLLRLREELQRLKPIVNTQKQYVIYCSRNNVQCILNDRRMIQENEDELVAYLKEYASEHNLEFYLLTGQEPDGSTTPVSKQYELFTNAKIVIGPHGGAFANIIFLDAKKKATVIELLYTVVSRTNFNILFNRNIEGWCNHHTIEYDTPNIDIIKIKSILEQVLLLK